MDGGWMDGFIGLSLLLYVLSVLVETMLAPSFFCPLFFCVCFGDVEDGSPVVFVFLGWQAEVPPHLVYWYTFYQSQHEPEGC